MQTEAQRRARAEFKGNVKKPVPVEEEVPVPIPVEDEEELDEDEFEEDPKVEERPIAKTVNPTNKEDQKDQSVTIDPKQIMEQIEALQNNGVYRMELLGQLDEIKRALVVIAGVLVDLNGNK